MIKWLSNLRVRFLGLALVAVLPALGLLILSANEQRDRALADAQTANTRLATLFAANQGRVIDSTRQLLVVLSRLPEVRSAGSVPGSATHWSRTGAGPCSGSWRTPARESTTP